MKILILTVIVLVIPLFFALIFVLSTYNKLAALRNHCHRIHDRIGAAPAPSSRRMTQSDPVAMNAAERDYLKAVESYESARLSFPARLVAKVFGFHRVADPSVPDPDKTPTVG